METTTTQVHLPSLLAVATERRVDHGSRESVASITSPPHASNPAYNHTAPSSQHPNQSLSYGQGPLSLTHLANAASKEFNTPPDSRRASGEEKELIAGQNMRQSLPSISEALGIDTNPPGQHQSGAMQAAQPTALHSAKLSQSSYTSTSPLSTMRSHAAEPPQPHADSYASSYASGYPHNVPPTTYAPSDPARGALSGLRPALHLHTPQTSSSPYAHPQGTAYQPAAATNPSPAQERPPPPAPPPAPAAASAQAPSTFPYGYTPYPPRYAPNGAAPNSGAAPAYHPASMNREAWERGPSTSPRYTQVEKSYGDSVKRHLDLYDHESALNDIASTSNFLRDFSRRYGELLHQSPQSGLNLSALPSIIEVEDMIAKSRTQTEALIKISETVLTRQAAHDEHKADIHRPRPYGDLEDGSHDQDEAKGPDAKKRRGRAAPPGRCHSCNRAETPEWRRGPDGARTLCNACGLHYAKLTRKANSAGKSTPISSSNLRPKDNMS